MKSAFVLVLPLLASGLLPTAPLMALPPTQPRLEVANAKGDRVSGGFGQGSGRKADGCPPLPADLLLTAFVPKTGPAVIGQTIAERPVFWFYVPYTHSSRVPARFSLQDEADNIVYETVVPLPPTQGIISVRVPPTVKSLPLNQPYRWTFQLECARPAPFVQGWVERVNPPVGITAAAKLPAAEKAKLYAQNGLWFDALNTLGEARRTKANDSALNTAWMQLFTQVQFDLQAENQTKLEEIVRQPIVQ